MDLDVKAFMTGQPISVGPDASAMSALDLMIDHGIRHLTVIDQAHQIRGVLSINDLRAALPIPVSLKVPPSVDQRLCVQDMLVGEVMTHSPISLRQDASLEDAVSRMLKGRIGCLPVVDEQGRLDGIVTETDLLEALATVLWSMHGRDHPPKSDDIITALETEKAHLVTQLQEYEQQTRARTRVHSETPMDFGELGESAEEAQMTEQLADLCSARLHAIENALIRAEQGEIEICERCGGRIPEPRLRALPGTTICIRCAREAEQVR